MEPVKKMSITSNGSELEKQPVEFLSEHRGFKDRLAMFGNNWRKLCTSEDRLVRCECNYGIKCVARSLPLGDEIPPAIRIRSLKRHGVYL